MRRWRRPRPTEVLRAAVGVAVAGLLITAAVWALGGGRWFVVRTASMGTAAPVGTLLWVQPVNYAGLHVGDFITFRPPGSSETYSHRISAVQPDGTLRTKGDANSVPDPWTLSRHNVIGKVAMRWWMVGWLVRAAPVLIGGALLLWLLVARFAGAAWRLPLAITGAAVLVSVSICIFRPLVGAQRLAYLPASDGIRATYVSTGLLPVRLTAAGGRAVDLRPGQIGTVVSHGPSATGKVLVNLRPEVPWWLWVGVFGACFLPGLTQLVGLTSRGRPGGAGGCTSVAVRDRSTAGESRRRDR